MGRRYEASEWVEWLLHLQDDNEKLYETEPNADVTDAAEAFSDHANRVFTRWAERSGYDPYELSLEFQRLGSDEDIALNTYYHLAGHGTGFWDELPDTLYVPLEAAIDKDKELQAAYKYFEDTLMDQAASVVYEDNPRARKRQKNPRGRTYLGYIGDSNPIEHWGGIVFKEPGEEDATMVYFQSYDDMVTIYRFSLDDPKDWLDWADWESIKGYTGIEQEDIDRLMRSKDPMDWAWLYEAVGQYHGFAELDHYPEDVTIKQAERTWGRAADAAYRAANRRRPTKKNPRARKATKKRKTTKKKTTKRASKKVISRYLKGL